MINPTGMTLRDWADSVIYAETSAWSFGRLDDEAEWQPWAAAFVRAPGFASNAPPDPYSFANWRDWAYEAYLMLEASENA